MRAGESERLAIVETKIDAMQADIVEMKGDIKMLLGANNQLSGGSNLLRWGAPAVAAVLSIAAFIRTF